MKLLTLKDPALRYRFSLNIYKARARRRCAGLYDAIVRRRARFVLVRNGRACS